MAGEQPSPPKTVLCARVSQAGFDYVKKLADEQDVSLSHMTRRMLLYAVAEMPKNWRPARDQR